MKKYLFLPFILLITLAACSEVTKDVNPIADSTLNSVVDTLKSIIDDNNSYLELIDKEDELIFYQAQHEFWICSNNEVQKCKIEIDSDSSIYSYYLSSDGTKVYYSTHSPSRYLKSRLWCYDLKSKTTTDLLNKFNIDFKGGTNVFSYRNDKIICLLANAGNIEIGENSFQETNRLLEIDIKGNTYKYIDLPYKPMGILVYKGLSFINDNYLILSSGDTSKDGQSIIIVNESGNIVQRVEIPESEMICNISASLQESILLINLEQHLIAFICTI